jgi:hypothetical protein
MHDRLKLGLELRAGNKKVVLRHLLRWRRVDLQGFGNCAHDATVPLEFASKSGSLFYIVEFMLY